MLCTCNGKLVEIALILVISWITVCLEAYPVYIYIYNKYIHIHVLCEILKENISLMHFCTNSTVCVCGLKKVSNLQHGFWGVISLQKQFFVQTKLILEKNIYIYCVNLKDSAVGNVLKNHTVNWQPSNVACNWLSLNSW